MQRIVLAVAVATLTVVPAIAQKRAPKDAAKVFTLDPATLSDPSAPATPPAETSGSTTVSDDSVAPPATIEAPASAAAATAAPSDGQPAENAPIVTMLGPAPSLDTPIEQLIADPRTRAVLDRDLPGLSTDNNLARFQKLSLRRFQPLTGGQLTAALLGKVGLDLAALNEKSMTTLAPVAPTTPSRRNRDSGR